MLPGWVQEGVRVTGPGGDGTIVDVHAQLFSVKWDDSARPCGYGLADLAGRGITPISDVRLDVAIARQAARERPTGPKHAHPIIGGRWA
jgi:hypothetical protein